MLPGLFWPYLRVRNAVVARVYTCLQRKVLSREQRITTNWPVDLAFRAYLDLRILQSAFIRRALLTLQVLP